MGWSTSRDHRWLLDQCRRLLRDAQDLQKQAANDFDRRDQLAAISQQGRLLELLGKALGRIGSGGVQVNVAVDAQPTTPEPLDLRHAAAQLVTLAEQGAIAPEDALALAEQLSSAALRRTSIDTTPENAALLESPAAPENAASVEAPC